MPPPCCTRRTRPCLAEATTLLSLRTPDENPGTISLAPVIDGEFLPQRPLDAFRDGTCAPDPAPHRHERPRGVALRRAHQHPADDEAAHQGDLREHEEEGAQGHQAPVPRAARATAGRRLRRRLHVLVPVGEGRRAALPARPGVLLPIRRGPADAAPARARRDARTRAVRALREVRHGDRRGAHAARRAAHVPRHRPTDAAALGVVRGIRRAGAHVAERTTRRCAARSSSIGRTASSSDPRRSKRLAWEEFVPHV